MRVLHIGLPLGAVAANQAADGPAEIAITSARPTRTAAPVSNSVFLGSPAFRSSGARSAWRSRDQTIRPSDVRRPSTVDWNETTSRSSRISEAFSAKGPCSFALSGLRHRVLPSRTATISGGGPVFSHQNTAPAEALTNNGLR